ncbi:MAG: thioredoxin fold domain-containing protein [Pseudomonadota bacterium]
MKLKNILISLSLLIPSTFVWGAGADDLRKVISEKLPGIEFGAITESPVAGIYEVAVGPEVVYFSADGQFLIQGDLIDLNAKKNLTEGRRNVARADAMDALGDDQMIVFGPESNRKHTITVFTDIDCGYCRKLHREIESFTDLGIRVRYLFYPRTGPQSESWSKAEKVWCSADRNESLTAAKAGKPVSGPICESNPIQNHYDMGVRVGLRGTPAIILETGELISGYVPAGELLKHMEAVNN